jgi:hypothetical protein
MDELKETMRMFDLGQGRRFNLLKAAAASGQKLNTRQA